MHYLNGIYRKNAEPLQTLWLFPDFVLPWVCLLKYTVCHSILLQIWTVLTFCFAPYSSPANKAFIFITGKITESNPGWDVNSVNWLLIYGNNIATVLVNSKLFPIAESTSTLKKPAIVTFILHTSLELIWTPTVTLYKLSSIWLISAGRWEKKKKFRNYYLFCFSHC